MEGLGSDFWEDLKESEHPFLPTFMLLLVGMRNTGKMLEPKHQLGPDADAGEVIRLKELGSLPAVELP